MHVAILTQALPGGAVNGVGAFYGDYADALVRRGHEVTLLRVQENSSGATPAPGALPYQVVNVQPVAPSWMRWRPGLLYARWQIRRAVASLHRRRPIDVLEVQDGYGLLPWGPACRIPWITRLHGPMFFYAHLTGVDQADPFVYRMEQRQLRAAPWLAAVSQYAAKALTPWCGSQTAKRLVVIPNGVDTERFTPGASVRIVPGSIAFANSLDPRKGLPELLLAFALVRRAHPTARLTVVGSHAGLPLEDSGVRERIRKWTEPLDPIVRDAVRFEGPLPRVEGVLPILQTAAVCCFPSHAETFGLAPAEAMAVGRPVIYADRGPGPELIEDGVSGLLCDPLSPPSIATAISRCLDQPAWAETLGARARARIVDQFGLERWMRANLELLDRASACRFTDGQSLPNRDPTA